eukprot:gene12345-12479_t
MIGLLQLPAFMLVVYVLYWSMPLAALFLHNNHRSWSDFFIDVYLTEGRAQFMGRMAVVYVFPMLAAPMAWMRGVICFKRGSIADKDAFNSWIDERMQQSPLPGLGLFPEGTRNLKPHSLPLKRGMLHYAYSRKLPVQMVITAHKEAAMDEKRYHVRFGVTCATGYSDVIHSSSYDNFEQFFKVLQSSWDKLWLEVFSADPAGSPAGFDFPGVCKLSQLFLFVTQVPLMLWLLSWCWSFWLAAVVKASSLLGFAGIAVQLVQVLPLVWLVVSVVYCYDGTLPQPLLAPDGTVLQTVQHKGSVGNGTKSKAL